MWQCALETLLPTILISLSVTSISSFRSKGGHECPNCGEQYIKTIDALTDKCVVCWPCPECNDGAGLSVPCPSTVTAGTEIKCIPCIHGTSFSDSSNTGQCQPCGTCSGKHEHVLHECTLEGDVKCDCDAGFYRNETTNDCLPCGSCSDCSSDDEIISKCQEEEGKNSEHPKPSSSLYSTVGDSEVGLTMIKSYSTVLATSSSLLMTSSYFHATKTPKLPVGFMVSKSPVPSRTQQIQATSAATTVLKWSKSELTPTQSASRAIYYQNIHKTENTHILIAVLAVVCAFIFICVLGFLYRKFKKVRKRRMVNDQRKQIKLSELKQNEQRNPVFGNENGSRRSSDVDVPTGNAQEVFCPREDSLPDLSSMINNSEDFNKTKDSVQDDRVLLNDQNTAVREAVQKGIPSSLDGGTSYPITKDDQGGFTIASVSEKIIPYGGPDSPNVSLQSKTLSAGNNTHVNVYLNLNPGNSEQISDPTQIQRAAFPPFTETTSHGNNLKIPALMSAMPLANQGAICGMSAFAAPAVQPSQGNRGYATHITNVPLPVIHKMCMLLDLERKLDDNNYRMLGNELGLNSIQINTLIEKCNSPSNVLLMQVFPALPNSGTLAHLIPILRKMERHDVTQVIDEWVN